LYRPSNELPSFLCAVYLLCGWYSDSFIGSFVAIILLLSLDFWTVKNITGRFMVGLRWWNYIDESGESKWVFECREQSEDSLEKLSSTEGAIFWAGLVAAPACWLLFLLTALLSLKLKWLVLVVIGLSLSCSNLLGYLRCRMGGQADSTSSIISGVANQYIQQRMLERVMSVFQSTPRTTTSSSLTV